MFELLRSTFGFPPTPDPASPTVGSSPGIQPTTTPVNISSSSIPPVAHEPQDPVQVAYHQISHYEHLYTQLASATLRQTETDILKVKNQAKAKKALALTKSTFAVRSADIEKQKTREVNTLVAKATLVMRRAYIEYRRNIANQEQLLTMALLERREQRHQYFPKPAEAKEHSTTTETSLLTSFGITAGILAHLPQNLSTTDLKTLNWARETLHATDTARNLALSQHAGDYLTDASTQLKAIHQKLKALPEQNNHQELSCQREINALTDTLTEYHSDFLLTEALSDEAAYRIARQHTNSLSEKARTLRELADSASCEARNAQAPNQQLLEHQAEIFSTLAAIADEAVQAYQQIADAYRVPLRETTETRTQLNKTLQELPSMRSADNEEQEQLEVTLAKLVQEVSIPLALQPTNYDLTILSQLDDITDKDSYAISGTHGQINLDALSSPIDNADRPQYHNGINLIRLALFKSYGMEVLHQFDSRFAAKITAQNPLTIGELKSFIASLNNVKPSYFLSAEQSPLEALTALVQLKGSSHEDKVIKLEPSFNPFVSKSSLNQPLVSGDDTISKAVAQIRKGLKNQFNKEEPFKTNISTIMAEFDHKFTDEGENKLLTVGALKLFIQHQAKKYNQEFSFTSMAASPITQSILWNILQSGITVIKNTPAFLGFAATSHGMEVVFVANLLLDTIEDLTAGWRMIH